MTITALPPPPSNSDNPTAFSSKASALLGALPQLVTEINNEVLVTIPGLVDTVANASATAINETIPAAVALVNEAVVQTAAGSATAAKVAAELARDAAQLSAGVYASTAAGLAATVSGKYFSVPSAEGAESLILYLNGAGVAVEQKRYPSSEAVDGLIGVLGAIEDISPLAQRTDDVDGKAIGGIGRDLRMYQGTPRGLWPMRDADMQNPLGVDGWPAFSAIPQDYPGSTLKAAEVRAPDDWQKILYIIPFLGQSLAGGGNDNATDTIFNPTPTYPGHAFMPVVGNKPHGRDFDSLIPLYEYSGLGYDSNHETPLTTMINTLVYTLQTKAGAQPKFATFMASQGASTWAQVGPGNDAFLSLAKGISGCVRAARSMGLRPVVPAVIYLQGEQDRGSGLSRDDVARNRLNMAREVRQSIRMLTGQAEETIVFVSQPNNSLSTDGLIPGHMLAPLDVDGREGIRLLPPHYPYTMPSNVHPDSASYVTMGKLIGGAVLAEVFGPGYYPLRIVETRWISETQVDLVYSLRTGPLVIDTSGTVVSPPTWTGSLYGYQVFDSTGIVPISSAQVVADMSIESVSGKRDRIVRLTLASAPAGRSVRLHYATRNDGAGASSGNLTGPRGCIRDSATVPVWANSQVIEL